MQGLTGNVLDLSCRVNRACGVEVSQARSLTEFSGTQLIGFHALFLRCPEVMRPPVPCGISEGQETTVLFKAYRIDAPPGDFVISGY